MNEVRKVAIIVAAGSGSRMGGVIPKQFQELAGTPLAIHPGLQFRRFEPGMELVYVIASGTALIWETLLQKYFPEGNWRLCMGGKTRYESVRNGVRSISGESVLVAIHDGARPFIDPGIISRSFQTAYSAGNAVVAVPVKDSLREAGDDGRSRSVDRTRFFSVQTPQVFWIGDLRPVYMQEDNPLFTDDATVMEQAGFSINMVEGSYANMKVTTPEDWEVAERLYQRLQNAAGMPPV